MVPTETGPVGTGCAPRGAKQSLTLSRGYQRSRKRQEVRDRYQSLGHPAAAGSPLHWDEEPTHPSILYFCDEALQLASPTGQALALHL